MYGRMMENSTKHLAGNVGQFVNHQYLTIVTVEQNEFSSSGRRIVPNRIYSRATKIWAILSVRTFTMVEESWFRGHVKVNLRFENSCYVAYALYGSNAYLRDVRRKSCETNEKVKCG